jgi:acetoin utilization deacetylase AcuC-like enzyme
MTNTYDVGLSDAVTDDEYLSTLVEWLPRLFDQHRPQLAFFQAGVDAMAKDSFGRSIVFPINCHPSGAGYDRWN